MYHVMSTKRQSQLEDDAQRYKILSNSVCLQKIDWDVQTKCGRTTDLKSQDGHREHHWFPYTKCSTRRWTLTNRTKSRQRNDMFFRCFYWGGTKSKLCSYNHTWTIIGNMKCPRNDILEKIGNDIINMMQIFLMGGMISISTRHSTRVKSWRTTREYWTEFFRMYRSDIAYDL